MQHDFFNDPLKLTIDGEWMTAIGTTLGADNGIGVAAGSTDSLVPGKTRSLEGHHTISTFQAVLQWF